MKKFTLLLIYCFTFSYAISQDLSQGYLANDLSNRPMQAIAKPSYLASINDPSFPNTVIRRISNANTGEEIVPMYSTIQSWNSDESLMIVYKTGLGHQLLNGLDYSFIRNLSDVNPQDIENIFWDFQDPKMFFYLENSTSNFIKYNVDTQDKVIIKNFIEFSNCTSGISQGIDVQMMSWDSDVISFRCGNTNAYYYRISTDTLTEFTIADIAFTAPMPFPSGDLFYHKGNVYNAAGTFERTLNLASGNEHSCLGRLSNGDDAYFAVAFAEGPNGGCLATLVVHNAITGNCFSVTPTTDYGFSQSGTHISSLAHKNNEGGWVAVSMLGYNQDGQSLLDQELLIAKVNENDADVYRVAHHRSDENEFDYFGEPHVTISPSGTRLLFGSDWSGSDDGVSIDSYVAELPAFNNTTLSTPSFLENPTINIFLNPTNDFIEITGINDIEEYKIYSLDGKLLKNALFDSQIRINVNELEKGLYMLHLINKQGNYILKFIKY